MRHSRLLRNVEGVREQKKRGGKRRGKTNRSGTEPFILTPGHVLGLLSQRGGILRQRCFHHVLFLMASLGVYNVLSKRTYLSLICCLEEGNEFTLHCDVDGI